MRKTAFMLIMLTLLGLFANLAPENARGQDSGPDLQPVPRSGGGGVIDSIINQSEIVIDDSVYRIDPNASFYASNYRSVISFREFKEGHRVDFVLNGNGDIIKLIKLAGR